MFRPKVNNIILGDCEQRLKSFPSNFFDLIITSPPYADARKTTYGGIEADKYNEWFLKKSNEFFRVLKNTGTFILNIKEKVVDGERHTYVLELIMKLREQGWLWTEEFIWHKTTSAPGKWPNRFRDAWERCLQFNKNKEFAMYQEAVMVPAKESTKKRMLNLNENDLARQASKTQSTFGRKMSAWQNRELVYPDNVLYMAAECKNKGHSACFPSKLPEFFIKLFTQENDIVLDPFVGSGTTTQMARKLNRKYIGIELNEEYHKLAIERTNQD